MLDWLIDWTWVKLTEVNWTNVNWTMVNWTGIFNYLFLFVQYMFSYTCSIDICSLFSQLVVECYLLFNSFIYAMSLVQNIYGLVEQRSKIWCSVSHLFSCPVVQFHVGQMAFEESVFCSIVLFNSCCSTAFVQATWKDRRSRESRKRHGIEGGGGGGGPVSHVQCRRGR